SQAGLARPSDQVLQNPRDGIARRNRPLKLGREPCWVAESLPGPFQGGPLVAEPYRLLLEHGTEVSQELLAHLTLARRTGPDGLDRPLDEDFQLRQGGLVHAGTPRRPPRMRTKCCHSAGPRVSSRSPLAVRR